MQLQSSAIVAFLTVLCVRVDLFNADASVWPTVRVNMSTSNGGHVSISPLLLTIFASVLVICLIIIAAMALCMCNRRRKRSRGDWCTIDLTYVL